MAEGWSGISISDPINDAKARLTKWLAKYDQYIEGVHTNKRKNLYPDLSEQDVIDLQLLVRNP